MVELQPGVSVVRTAPAAAGRVRRVPWPKSNDFTIALRSIAYETHVDMHVLDGAYFSLRLR